MQWPLYTDTPTFIYFIYIKGLELRRNNTIRRRFPFFHASKVSYIGYNPPSTTTHKYLTPHVTQLVFVKPPLVSPNRPKLGRGKSSGIPTENTIHYYYRLVKKQSSIISKQLIWRGVLLIKCRILYAFLTLFYVFRNSDSKDRPRYVLSFLFYRISTRFWYYTLGVMWLINRINDTEV